jgi:hypothetical protein
VCIGDGFGDGGAAKFVGLDLGSVLEGSIFVDAIDVPHSGR